MTKQVDEHTHMLTDMSVDYLKRTVADLKDRVEELEERLEQAESSISLLVKNQDSISHDLWEEINGYDI